MEKQYVKGFILDGNMVAKACGNRKPRWPASLCIYSGDGYKFIGAVHRNTLHWRRPGSGIVLEGDDYEAPRKMVLQPIDDTIAAAQPHVLLVLGALGMTGTFWCLLEACSLPSSAFFFLYCVNQYLDLRNQLRLCTIVFVFNLYTTSGDGTCNDNFVRSHSSVGIPIQKFKYCAITETT